MCSSDDSPHNMAERNSKLRLWSGEEVAGLYSGYKREVRKKCKRLGRPIQPCSPARYRALRGFEFIRKDGQRCIYLLRARSCSHPDCPVKNKVLLDDLTVWSAIPSTQILCRCCF